MGAGASSKSKWEAEASKCAVEVEKQASKDMKSVKHLSLEIKHELHTHCQQSVHAFFDLLSKSVGVLGLGDAVGVSAAFTLFGSEIEVARSPLHLGHRKANWKSLVDHPSTPPAKDKKPSDLCARIVADFMAALTSFAQHIEALVVHTIVGFENAARFCFSDLSFKVELDPVPLLDAFIDLSCTVRIDVTKIGTLEQSQEEEKKE